MQTETHTSYSSTRNYLRLVLSWILFLIPFLVTRLPFFLYYRVNIIKPDYSGYFQIVDQMNRGMLPHLSIRTIGYPLFLKLAFAIRESNFTVVVIQNLFTIFCCFFFIYAIYRICGKFRLLPFIAALAMAAFATSMVHLESDCMLMSDSLFVNFLILSFAFLLLGLHTKPTRFFLLSSLTMSFAIVVRPAGLFLLVMIPFLIAFLLINRYSRVALLAAILPLVLILSGVAAFNWITIGTFSVSTFGEHALISFTSTFLEPHPSFARAENEAAIKCRAALMPRQKAILKNSWDYWKILRVELKHFDRKRILINQIFFSHEPADTYDLYLKWRKRWRKMGIYAMRRHPRTAAKYFYANSIALFYLKRRDDADFYRDIRQAMVRSQVLKSRFASFANPESFFVRRFNSREYARTLSPQFLRDLLKEDYFPRRYPYTFLDARRGLQLKPTFLLNLHLIYQKWHRLLFRQTFWFFLYLAAFLFALVRLLKTRLRHRGVFVLFWLTLSTLVYGLFLGISAIPILRYSYIFDYIYYFSPFLCLLAVLPEPQPAAESVSIRQNGREK